MILDAIIILVTGILGIIYLFMSAITYTIPPEINAAFNEFFGYFGFIEGIFPVDTFLNALFTYLTASLLIYGWKIMLWAYSLIPIFGRTGNSTPEIEEGDIDTANKELGKGR